MLLNTMVKTIKRKSHRGDQAVTSDQITTDIIACINEAYRECARKLPKQFFWKQGTIAVTTGVAGTPAVYSLPSDCQEPIGFWYTVSNAYYKLRKINSDGEWLAGVWNPAVSVNLPYMYREIGPDGSGNKQIEIFPIPNQDLTLNVEYYRQKTADLDSTSLSSSLPDLPDYVIDVVEKGALYLFLQGFDDPMQARAKAEYEQAKVDFDAADELNSDTLPAMRFPKKQYYLPGFRLES